MRELWEGRTTSTTSLHHYKKQQFIPRYLMEHDAENFNNHFLIQKTPKPMGQQLSQVLEIVAPLGNHSFLPPSAGSVPVLTRLQSQLFEKVVKQGSNRVPTDNAIAVLESIWNLQGVEGKFEVVSEVRGTNVMTNLGQSVLPKSNACRSGGLSGFNRKIRRGI